VVPRGRHVGPNHPARFNPGRNYSISANMMMVTLIAAVFSGVATWAAARFVLGQLAARGVMDRPNERSSHDRPVPRGGGLAVIGVIAPVWLVVALFNGILATVWPVVLAALALAALSFIDDLRGLPPLPRVAAHIIAVSLGLWLLPDHAMLFDGWLPLWADRIVTALAWIWFINLFNFMDGIDGITGVETIAVTGGLAFALIVMVSDGGGDWSHAPLAAVLAGAAAGFLVLNWHPARLFLGDVGSVPLGYLIGWLLVWAACVASLWWLVLILPLYYWGDATTVLIRRALKGEKIWHAHRSHAYQLAVQAGASHAHVSLLIATLNLALVALTLCVAIGAIGPWTALVPSALLTLAALCYLRFRLGRKNGSPA